MKNIFNGNLIESSKYIEIYSPIDGSYIGKTPAMSKQEVEESIKNSKHAFKFWSNLSMKERSEYLYKICDELEKSKYDIANTMVLEIAKTFKDSLKEVERTIDLIKFTAEEGLRLYGEVIDGGSYNKSDKGKISLTKYIPYGVVLCISPFNYPINLSASKIATALIGGNTVIFKPATQGSQSALKFVEAIYRAKLPDGVFNSVTGKGSEIGDFLNTNENISLINFTGSTSVGRDIANKVSMIPLIMELGGKDAAIVLEDANLKNAAKEIILGAFSYSGQRCTAIKRVLVIDSVADELVKYLNENLSLLKVGTAKEENDVTELIDKYSADYIENLINDTLNLGRITKQKYIRKDNLIYPMIFDFVERNDKIAIEEPFGPILPIIRVKSINEAIEIANESEYGLQSSVFTENIDKAFMIADKLEVGTVHINNKTQRGPDNFPFLGYKNSGIGIQGIKYSILSMMKIKSIVFSIKEL